MVGDTDHKETSGYKLLPAFNPKEANEIIESLRKERGDIVKLIRSINGAIKDIITSDELKATIDISFEQFKVRTKEFYDDIQKGKEGNIGAPNFIKYLNLFFELLKIKKIYNTCPADSFYDFYKTTENDQLLRIVLPYGKDLPFFPFTTGGSCHNFSILFKDYFDILGIKSKIIFCPPFSNHSFVLCEIFGKHYIFDTLLKPGNEPLFEVKAGSLIQIGIDTKGQITEIGKDLSLKVKKISSHHYEQNYPTKELYSFSQVLDFVNKIDTREIKYIIAGYRLSDGREFQIEFSKENSQGNIEFSCYFGVDSKTPKYKIEVGIKKIRTFLEKFSPEEISEMSVEQIFKVIFEKFQMPKEMKNDTEFWKYFGDICKLIRKQNVLDFLGQGDLKNQQNS